MPKAPLEVSMCSLHQCSWFCCVLLPYCTLAVRSGCCTPSRHVKEVASEAGAAAFRATFELNDKVLVVSNHPSDIESAFAWDLYYRALVSRCSGTAAQEVLARCHDRCDRSITHI